MDNVPAELKKLLKNIYKIGIKSRELNEKLNAEFEKYGLDMDYFTGNTGNNDDSTEALTFIDYGEGDFQESFKDFERVFLYHMKKKNDD